MVCCVPVPVPPLMAAEIIKHEDRVRDAHNDEVSCNHIFEFLPDVAADEQLDAQSNHLDEPDGSGEHRRGNYDPAHGSVPGSEQRRFERVQVRDEHLDEGVEGVPDQQLVALAPPVERIDHHPNVEQEQREERKHDRQATPA